ncbi:MAG TPA: hypothetical protein PKD70_08530, partial [Saprospiraceae bacterium]|nr:hypothetical protein [Saprospiraceae bacterium]HMP13913.1 hypothetical protein [Saprospiraceae bacterium]
AGIWHIITDSFLRIKKAKDYNLHQHNLSSLRTLDYLVNITFFTTKAFLLQLSHNKLVYWIKILE